MMNGVPVAELHTFPSTMVTYFKERVTVVLLLILCSQKTKSLLLFYVNIFSYYKSFVFIVIKQCVSDCINKKKKVLYFVTIYVHEFFTEVVHMRL